MINYQVVNEAWYNIKNSSKKTGEDTLIKFFKTDGRQMVETEKIESIERSICE